MTKPSSVAPEPSAPELESSPWLGLAALGGVLILVSNVLPWVDELFDFGTVNATGVPFQFIWDITPASLHPSYLVILIPAGLSCLVPMLRPHLAWLAIGGGVAAILATVLLALAIQNAIDDPLYAFEGSPFDFFEIGAYVCLAGGVIALVGGVVTVRTGRRA